MSLLERALARRAQEDERRGNARDNFTIAASIANDLGVVVSSQDCVKVMLAIKFMRLLRNPADFDTQVDIAGYLDILAEIQGAGWPIGQPEPPQAEPEGCGPPLHDCDTNCWGLTASEWADAQAQWDAVDGEVRFKNGEVIWKPYPDEGFGC